jgi:putative ABC transport system permease protein
VDRGLSGALDYPGLGDDDTHTAYLGVVNAEMLTRGIVPPVVEGSLQTFTDGTALGQIALSESAAKESGLKVGDTVTLTVAKDTPAEASTELTVQAVISSEMWWGAVITEQTLESMLPVETWSQMVFNWWALVVVEPGVNADEVRAQLVDIVAPYHMISVLDRDEFTTALGKQVTQVLNILIVLIALSLVIAVLGVVNTLALSVTERTQEIGMMRAVGLGRGQLRWMMVIEGALIAGFGAALGVAAGVGVAAVFPSTMESQGLGALSIPWPTMAWLFVGASVVGILAAVWPAVRASRVPVLQALVYE